MIGETIYLYNENRRVYEDGEGNKTSYTKKTLDVGYISPGYKNRAYTEEAKQAALWLEQNHNTIRRAVDACTDVTKLMAIWNILQEDNE